MKLEAPSPDGLASAKVIVPENEGAAIQTGGAYDMNPDLVFAGWRMFVRDIVGGPNQVRVFDLDGKPQGKLPLPDIAANNSEIEPLAGGDVLFNVRTYLRPRYFARWIARTVKTEETALKVISPVRLSDAVVTRVFATSQDGTRCRSTSS